jgi:hypothetical protein
MKPLILSIPAGINPVKTKIDVICKQMGITSQVQIDLIYAIYKLFPASFGLNTATKQAIISHFGGGISENNLSTTISRLIENKALIRNGKLLSLAPQFEDIENKDCIVIKLK